MSWPGCFGRRMRVLPLLFSYKERYLSVTTDTSAFNGYYFMITIANGVSLGVISVWSGSDGMRTPGG